MRYRVHANAVLELSKETGINTWGAARRLAKENEKTYGKHYVKGFNTGLNGTSRLTRKDFIRTRDYNSYVWGFMNGRRIYNTLKNYNLG